MVRRKPGGEVARFLAGCAENQGVYRALQPADSSQSRRQMPEFLARFLKIVQGIFELLTGIPPWCREAPAREAAQPLGAGGSSRGSNRRRADLMIGDGAPLGNGQMLHGANRLDPPAPESKTLPDCVPLLGAGWGARGGAARRGLYASHRRAATWAMTGTLRGASAGIFVLGSACSPCRLADLWLQYANSVLDGKLISHAATPFTALAGPAVS